jgi:hypothetical protein
MGNEARRDNKVGAIAEDLIGDVNVTALGVTRHALHFGSSLHARFRATLSSESASTLAQMELAVHGDRKPTPVRSPIGTIQGLKPAVSSRRRLETPIRKGQPLSREIWIPTCAGQTPGRRKAAQTSGQQ